MKVRLQLRPRTVDGIECPFPVVKLRVQDKYGTFVPLLFRVDTQADFTTIPVEIARREQIGFQEQHKVDVFGIAGTAEAYRDRIRVVLAAQEHDWPCQYVVSPAGLTPRRPGREVTPVLGRA